MCINVLNVSKLVISYLLRHKEDIEALKQLLVVSLTVAEAASLAFNIIARHALIQVH